MDEVRVQRANVILDIGSDEKARYMNMGYSVIDAKTGEIIEEAVSTNVNELQTQVKELLEKVATKDKEITKLKKQVTDLKAANKG